MNIKLLIASTLVLTSLSTFMATSVQARGIDVNTQNTIMNNFATRQAQLNAQVNSALAAGQLSYGQANSLRAQLNSLAVAQNQAMAQGAFSPMQTQNIMNGFTAVTNQLNQSISYNSQYTPYRQATPFVQYNTYENNPVYRNAAPYTHAAPYPNSVTYQRRNADWYRTHPDERIAHPYQQ